MNDMKGKLITVSMASLVLMVGTFIMSAAAPQIEQSITDFHPVQISDFAASIAVMIIIIFVGLVFHYLRCNGGIS